MAAWSALSSCTHRLYTGRPALVPGSDWERAARGSDWERSLLVAARRFAGFLLPRAPKIKGGWERCERTTPRRTSWLLSLPTFPMPRRLARRVDAEGRAVDAPCNRSHHELHQNQHHLMPGVVLQRVDSMRTTVVLDDQLLEQAQRMTGLTGRTALLRAGLRALIELESARRLARLGGTEPKLEEIPRRRGKSA